MPSRIEVRLTYMSAVSSVGDLRGGYIKESLKKDEKRSVRPPRGGNVVSRVEREAIRTTTKDGEKGKTKYQQQTARDGGGPRALLTLDNVDVPACPVGFYNYK
jgi:hypothetical protein